MALNSLIRAEGNARIPMTGMMIGAVTNIILCAIFIIPLDMGVRGSALATVIAQLVSVVFFMSYYFSGKSFLKIHLRNLAIQWNILKEILAIGIASFSRLMAASLSAIFVNRMLITYGGDLAISAFGIINRIMMFAIMPGIAIGGGMQPIVGFNYGAKRYDRALRAIKIAMFAATACCLVVFMVLYFAPEPFIRIFTTDSELIALSSYAAKRVFFVSVSDRLYNGRVAGLPGNREGDSVIRHGYIKAVSVPDSPGIHTAPILGVGRRMAGLPHR